MDKLLFEHFNAEDAHTLGEAMRADAVANKLPIVIDIRAGDTPLYAVMCPGATAENFDWARRKRNLTLLTKLDTWTHGQRRLEGHDILDELGLDVRDYASHGGCIPVFTGDGIIGATVTVSGLPQKDDHELALKHLTELWHRHLKEIA
jgi:uncharacterized protein (UPF0303 family)